jgi:hypothetical protein
MTLYNLARRALTLTAGLFLLACSSGTQLTSSWKNPDMTGAPLQKVAVFVIAKNDAVRRYAEDQMAANMPKEVNAVVGYSLFARPEQNVDTVRDYLIKNGFDGVLVTRLVDIDKTSKYVPPRTYVQSAPVYGGGYYAGRYGYYNSFNGYYGNAFGATYVTTTPGYEKKQTNVIVETMLYRLPKGELLWTGTTETLNPEKKSELVDGIVDIVDSKINQQGLLKGGR